MPKNDKPKKRAPGMAKTKVNRNHKRNRTQEKWEMGMGVVWHGKSLRVLKGSPFRLDPTDPILLATAAQSQHKAACDRCSGRVKLKQLDDKGETKMVYAPCNKGRALTKRVERVKPQIVSQQAQAA